MIKFIKQLFRKKTKLTKQELGYIDRDIAITYECIEMLKIQKEEQ